MSGNDHLVEGGLESREIRLADPVPFVRLPNPKKIFTGRADRLDQLSTNRHSQGRFFAFMSAVARCQQDALDRLSLFDPPQERLEHCRGNPLPPIDVRAIKPGPAWHETLTHVARQIESLEIPAAARSALKRLRQIDARVLEGWAEAMLRGIYAPVNRALAPFLSAALQVCWVGMAGRLDAEKLIRLENPGLCPACGMPPLAGIVCADPAVHGSRYLCCGLCATQWHMVRIKCSHCGSMNGISYYAIEGRALAVKGETCDTCRTYLKIMYEEEDTRVDPFADDLATVALDVLLGEAGWGRLVPPPFVFTSH